MLPHKLYRGAQALDRLKVFEGIPPPYDKVSSSHLVVDSSSARVFIASYIYQASSKASPRKNP